MAVSGDEWNGELTQFLDRLPARPCLVPPPPSFCSVCGSIDGPVASVCRFYPLRHERVRGQTFIEQPSRKRPDSFELDIDFSEEDDGSEQGQAGGDAADEDSGSGELEGSDMFEFSRPTSAVKVRGSIRAVPPANAERPEEVDSEIYDAEVVEVIEEPEQKPAPKAAPRSATPAAAHPARVPERTERKVAGLARMVREEKKPLRMEEKRGQKREETKEEKRVEKKQERRHEGEEEKRELKPEERPEKQGTAMRAPEAPMMPSPGTRVPGPFLAPPLAPVPPPAPGKMVLSRDEEERLEREIEEELAKAGLHKELEESKPISQTISRGPEPDIATDSSMPKGKVIAPIYAQPILKIIPAEAESPHAYEGQPLPPPPPGYEGPLPPRSEKIPIGFSTQSGESAIPAATIQSTPVPQEKQMAEPMTPATPAVQIETSPPPPPAPPKEAPLVPGQRRTGGLYGIFQKKPKELQTPEKKEVDEELAKRLKKTDK